MPPLAIPTPGRQAALRPQHGLFDGHGDCCALIVMRHLAWLSGFLLILSCSVKPVENPDGAGPGGGGGAGGAGTTGSGGQGGATTGTGGGAGDRSTGGSGGGQAGTSGGQAGAGGGQAGTSGGQAGAGGGSAGHAGGGHGGHPADAGQTCDELETDYGTALTAARQCSPGSAGQCQHLVPTSLSCPGCKEYVNDVTTLNTITAEWNDQDCAATPHVCPAIACINPGSGTCSGNGNGPPQCQNGPAGPTAN
jgi:hypothetical protein